MFVSFVNIQLSPRFGRKTALFTDPTFTQMFVINVMRQGHFVAKAFSTFFASVPCWVMARVYVILQSSFQGGGIVTLVAKE